MLNYVGNDVSAIEDTQPAVLLFLVHSLIIQMTKNNRSHRKYGFVREVIQQKPLKTLI